MGIARATIDFSYEHSDWFTDENVRVFIKDIISGVVRSINTPCSELYPNFGAQATINAMSYSVEELSIVEVAGTLVNDPRDEQIARLIQDNAFQRMLMKRLKKDLKKLNKVISDDFMARNYKQMKNT